jgi:hypothetical protein
MQNGPDLLDTTKEGACPRAIAKRSKIIDEATAEPTIKLAAELADLRAEYILTGYSR